MDVHEAHTACKKRPGTVAMLRLLGLVAILLYCCAPPVPKSLVAAPDYPLDTTALSLRMTADSLYYAGKPDSALVYARASAEKAETTADWHTWGEAQTYILASQYELKAYAESAQTFPALEKKAQALIPEGNLRDSAFWGDFYNTAGAIYNELGNYEAALKYGKLEINFYKKLGSKTDIALANNNVSNFYLGRGDYDRALEYALAALQFYTSDSNTSPFDLVLTYHNLGNIYYRQSNYSKSVAYAKTGLQLLKAQCPEKKQLEAKLNITLAGTCTDASDYKQAFSFLHESLKIELAQKDSSDLLTTLDGLGFVCTMMDRPAEATSYFQHALRLAGKDYLYSRKLCRHIGILYQNKGELWTALQWKQKALQVSPEDGLLANPTLEGVNQVYDVMYALVEKGEILQLLSQQEAKPALLDASLEAYDLATALLDSIRIIYQEGSKQFWNQEAHPILEQAIDIALQLHQRSGSDRYLEKAFKYAEKGKAYLLTEALQESMANQKAGIPEHLLEQEKQIKIDIAYYKKQIYEERLKQAADEEKILRWHSEILRRHQASETLMAKLKSDYPNYYQIKYQQVENGIANIQQKLPENTGLIEYFHGEKATYAFYIDRTHARAQRCTSDSVLLHLFNGLHDQDRVAELGRSVLALQAFATDAAGLYSTLIGPVLKQIPAQLIVVPDGTLAYLPFELLLTHEADKTQNTNFATLPYLLKETTLRYEYSASLAFHNPIERHPLRFFDGYAPAYGKDIIAGVTRGGKINCQEWETEKFANLANNRQEVMQVAEATHGRAIVGAEATEAFFRQHAHEPRILHLAMHGFLNDCDPAYSGLVFSPMNPAFPKDSLPEEKDGILYAYEVYNLHLNAELAVLSACNTGQGQLAKGEGVMSLARAFKYAGCPNVLMSLWQADDKATADIMTIFYNYLNRGFGKAAAIRQAKLDYLAESSSNHPFFWAAFILIGDNEPLESSTPWFWYGIGLLLVFFSLFWLRKLPNTSLFMLFKNRQHAKS